MRVITGSARGRRLKTPDNYDIRPTTDNVKEAVFNILQFDVEGRKVLDLFAGTGQLGIEALSRGAASAVFIDHDRAAVQIVKDNLKTCGLSGTVICGDALSFLKSGGRFDFVLLGDSITYNWQREKGRSYFGGDRRLGKAVADECFEFNQWSDGSKQNPRTITVTANTNLTAEFNKVRYTVTGQPSTGGKVQIRKQ